LRSLRFEALRALAATTGGSAAMRGAASGLLHGDGEWADEELIQALRGHFQSTRDEGVDGPNFLRGLLKTDRSAFWQVEKVLESVDRVLREWDEDRFVKLLPHVRLALSDLTPRETDAVARKVAVLLGFASLNMQYVADIGSEEMLRAVDVNRLVKAALTADGLEMLCE
jgi:hypothetical protein